MQIFFLRAAFLPFPVATGASLLEAGHPAASPSLAGKDRARAAERLVRARRLAGQAERKGETIEVTRFERRVLGRKREVKPRSIHTMFGMFKNGLTPGERKSLEDCFSRATGRESVPGSPRPFAEKEDFLRRAGNMAAYVKLHGRFADQYLFKKAALGLEGNVTPEEVRRQFDNARNRLRFDERRELGEAYETATGWRNGVFGLTENRRSEINRRRLEKARLIAEKAEGEGIRMAPIFFQRWLLGPQRSGENLKKTKSIHVEFSKWRSGLSVKERRTLDEYYWRATHYGKVLIRWKR